MIILKAHRNNLPRNINYNVSNFLKFSKKFRVDYDPSKDYYKILEISQSASDKEIKAAYYNLAKQHHPDLNKGQSSEKFKEINQAYEILSDKEKKIQYDASRKLNSYWGAKNYTSNQNSSTYSGYNTNYYKQYSNYNYKDDPFFKNFNDWFTGFKNQDKNEQYKSNFRTGKKYDFGKSYYQKNKDYFSSFKIKEEDSNESYSYTRNKSESKTKSFKSKKEATFGKDYMKRNQKYYESFKNKNEYSENDYNENRYYQDNTSNQEGFNLNSSPFLIFIISLFGVVIGSMIIRSLLAPSHRAARVPVNYSQNSNPSYDQPTNKTKTPPSTNYNKDYSTPHNNVFGYKEIGNNEAEFGVKDDPFYKK
jgi:curved DNA-binding protein CbpA